MNRNKLLLISLAGSLLVAVPVSQVVWSKAHVPLDQVQICDKGKVKNIKVKDLSKKLAKGACRLPACTFSFVAMPGDVCILGDTSGHPVSGGADGFCDVPGPASVFGPEGALPNAVGFTSACTNPF